MEAADPAIFHPFKDMKNRWLKLAGDKKKKDLINSYFHQFYELRWADALYLVTSPVGYPAGSEQLFVSEQTYTRCRTEVEASCGIRIEPLLSSPCLSADSKTELQQFTSLGQLTEFLEKMYAKNREIQIKDTIAMGQLELINSGKKFLATEDETFTIFALDFETYEWSHDKVLEAGLTQCQVHCRVNESGRTVSFSNLSASHYIVAEHLEYKNKKFCDSNREGFQFGASQTLPLEEVKRILASTLNESRLLVCHNASAEKGTLKRMNISYHTEVRDTQIISYILPDRNGSLIGLRNLYVEILKLNELVSSQTTIAMHNAGNDAYCTLMSFILLLRHYLRQEFVCDIQFLDLL